MNIRNHHLSFWWLIWCKTIVNAFKRSILSVSLSLALQEVKETAKLIHTEIEETAKLFPQHLRPVTEHAPVHLVLQNLLHQLFVCIRQVMDVDTVAVLLQTEDEQHLAVCATLGLEEEIVEGIRIPIGRGFAGCVAASSKLVIVEDLSKVEVVSPILRDKGLQSMLGTPLLSRDRVIGVLHVGTVSPRQFTMKDTQLLQQVAAQIELAIAALDSAEPSTAKGTVLPQEKLALAGLRQKLSHISQKLSLQPTFYQIPRLTYTCCLV